MKKEIEAGNENVFLMDLDGGEVDGREQLEASSSSSMYPMCSLHFRSYMSVRLKAELSAVLTRSRLSTKPAEQSNPRELSSMLGLYSCISVYIYPSVGACVQAGMRYGDGVCSI